jgi:hypothetical protein
MSSWKHSGSPYLPGSDHAHRIEGREAWKRTRERLDREAGAEEHQASGSELAEDAQGEERQRVAGGGR